MITEAQRRAVAKYKKRTYKTVSFILNKETEKNLIEAFEKIPNKQEWFRECLRREVNHDGSGKK